MNNEEIVSIVRGEGMSIDEAFVAAIEEQAAKLEVTVDYYLEEFFL